MIKFLINRIKEPSTLAGLGTLAVIAGASTDTAQAITQVVGGLLGLAAVLLPEGK